MRRKTRKVYVGNVPVGGDAPIAVQSMNTTYTRDVKSTVAQIHRLQDVGCEIARVAVPEMEDALVIGEIIKQIKIPLVADIHYDPALAMDLLDKVPIKCVSIQAISCKVANLWNRLCIWLKSAARQYVSVLILALLMRWIKQLR